METLKAQYKTYQQLLIVAWIFRIIDSSIGACFASADNRVNDTIFVFIMLFWIVMMAGYIYFANKISFEKTYFTSKDVIAPRKIITIIIGLNILQFLDGVTGLGFEFIGFIVFGLFFVLLISIRIAKKRVIKAQNNLNITSKDELVTSVD